MTFKEDSVQPFLQLFEKYKSQIRDSEGCLDLKLIQNTNFPNEISTLSYWENENYLNSYRKSFVFGEVWPLTKALFAEKPRAITYNIIQKT